MISVLSIDELRFLVPATLSIQFSEITTNSKYLILLRVYIGAIQNHDNAGAKFVVEGGRGEAEAVSRGAKENSGDFRKRLHKRAHLNFSNSPAFHFPDGRSFVRTMRLLRALVSFAGSLV